MDEIRRDFIMLFNLKAYLTSNRSIVTAYKCVIFSESLLEHKPDKFPVFPLFNASIVPNRVDIRKNYNNRYWGGKNCG